MADVRSASGPEITAADLYALLRLRVDVFVVEQECPYPELDGVDLLPSTRHLWLADGDTVLGCLRIIDDGGVLRVGRVCTSVEARGTGAGARLMTAALDVVGGAESVLGAQTYATGFYERFGYRPEGEPYDEDGIPHITMRRTAPFR
ncbi:MAG: GNAT family N-acetyltransferase [Actinophytocola sp.]|nr:GNAT family N-acetyltransferase [Actinophytocola sp.]